MSGKNGSGEGGGVGVGGDGGSGDGNGGDGGDGGSQWQWRWRRRQGQTLQGQRGAKKAKKQIANDSRNVIIHLQFPHADIRPGVIMARP